LVYEGKLLRHATQEQDFLSTKNNIPVQPSSKHITFVIIFEIMLLIQ
jgi:hypothetical protein